MAQIFIVSNDRDGLTTLLALLNDAGHYANGACTFEDAKRLLAAQSPDLVIADERLGAFNGLHIIVRARAEHPHVAAIVTTAVKSAGLEADARGVNAECLVKPRDAAEWVSAILKAVGDGRLAPSAAMPLEATHAIH